MPGLVTTSARQPTALLLRRGMPRPGMPRSPSRTRGPRTTPTRRAIRKRRPPSPHARLAAEGFLTPCPTPSGGLPNPCARIPAEGFLTPMSESQWNWWRERRVPAELSYFDTAAVGRASRATLAAMASYAEREAALGGYIAGPQRPAGGEPVLAEGLASLGRLFGVPAAGVAFVPSAQDALDLLLGVWP